MQTPTQDPQDPPGTPPRPPYSPVTPVFAQLAPVPSNEPKIVPPPLSPSPTSQPPATHSYPRPPPANPPVYKPEPPPVPISESENPDAIALRSAISILQMQKQQSLRDMQTLDRMKSAAEANPEAFAHDLATGRLKTEDRGAVVQFSDDQEGTEEDDGKRTNPDGSSASSFGNIPPPQNIVRMPPINWAKYSVVGEPLDRMHKEQLRRPHPGEPRWERAPEHVLASPYRPLVDQLETPAKLGRSSKTKKT
ncbi:unnamed protein product [Penicillium salamii]|uniref:Uncharacterized protein n=1 Tax=Penicillium salamii TaxID=1612424 RepID=A0A9W4JE34_9EURO|nr:unnamed protein product [Penicillium salamii]CAG8385143.1 unnamed protein product [Penicillium salamii]CAG8386119.1 unnamed protein product [Penicillium salamii]CAG8415999.1 unnamed protein product [Penicillium salamii]CAG8941119.1 unnamed protein product [Penicillium salamii]